MAARMHVHLHEKWTTLGPPSGKYPLLQVTTCVRHLDIGMPWTA